MPRKKLLRRPPIMLARPLEAVVVAIAPAASTTMKLLSATEQPAEAPTVTSPQKVTAALARDAVAEAEVDLVAAEIVTAAPV